MQIISHLTALAPAPRLPDVLVRRIFKVREALVRDMLFADDAAVASHTQQELQSFFLGLQRLRADHQPEEDERPGTELGGTANHYNRGRRTRRRSSLYVHRLHHPRKPVLGHRDRQEDRKCSYNSRSPHDSCVDKPQADSENKDGSLQRLCHQHIVAGSEKWVTYIRHERRLNTFYPRSIRRILGKSWEDRVSNAEVLSRAGLPSMYTLLRQRRLRWPGHVHRMNDGRIPKDIIYGELASG